MEKEGRRLHRASRMMIAALNEALAQDRQFKPDLAVIGTTSGGMSFGEDYYRALHGHGGLRHAPAGSRIIRRKNLSPMRWKRLELPRLVRSLPTPARPAQTRSDMRFNAFDRGAINAS